MFCGECGTKNEKGAKFCEKCGAKLEVAEEKKESPKAQQQPLKTSKPLTKQNKIIIAAVSAVVVLLIAFVAVGSSLASPKRLVKNYIDAISTKNYDKLYSYMVNVESGDKTFVSKDAFKEIYKAQESEMRKFTYYQLGIIDYGLGKLTATVPVTYRYDGGSGEKDVDIKLQKSNKKTLLFFDKWELTSSFTVKVVEDYQITVPTGATVVYAGIKVDKKYLDKSKSTSTNDVYVLNQVLGEKTPIKVTLKNGIVIEDTDTPSKYYNTYTARVKSSNISEAMKTTLTKQAKDDLKEIYAGVLANKKFAELNSKSFDSKLSSSYESYLSSLQASSRKLTKMDITDVKYYSISSTTDGYLELQVKMYFDYTVSYDSVGETKTKDKSTYDYVYLTYEMSGKSYKLRNVRSLPTYFSIY